MATVKDQYDIAVCDDCLMADAGYTAEEAGREYSAEYPPLSLIPTGATITADFNLEAHFFASPCPGCGETLGGDRYYITITEWA